MFIILCVFDAKRPGTVLLLNVKRIVIQSLSVCSNADVVTHARKRMWVLVSQQPAVVYHLAPDRTYEVGRKNNDILIENEKSISRNHAVLSVARSGEGSTLVVTGMIGEGCGMLLLLLSVFTYTNTHTCPHILLRFEKHVWDSNRWHPPAAQHTHPRPQQRPAHVWLQEQLSSIPPAMECLHTHTGTGRHMQQARYGLGCGKWRGGCSNCAPRCAMSTNGWVCNGMRMAHMLVSACVL